MRDLATEKRPVEFGPFRLDLERRRLLRGGYVVPLTPKVLDLLVLLVSSPGQPLQKDELMKALWPDTTVEEGNLTQTVSLLRKALGTAPDGRDYIETLPKRGLLCGPGDGCRHRVRRPAALDLRWSGHRSACGSRRPLVR